MKAMPSHLRIVLLVALIHCLLAFSVEPVGWVQLYSWDSPHWLRAIWASIFDLPLSIVFGRYAAFQAPILVFLLVPLNSLIFSWLVVTPVSAFVRFTRMAQRRDLMLGSLHLGIAGVLLGMIGICWIPPNIISQKEATIQNLRQIDAAVQEFEHANNMTQKP